MARVLIVEDEPTDRVILANLLERMGHEVHFASDGEEAFKTYLKNSIEIIITDLNMPHVDGLEFIGAVRALLPEPVIIAVSGKGADLLDAALRAGARAALSKPVDPWELLEAILAVTPDSSGRGKKDVQVMTPHDEPFILIVEDNPDQAALIQAAFKTNLAQSKTHLVFYGWEAQAYLNRQSGGSPKRWTPILFRERSPRCQEQDHRIRRSSGNRWSSWSKPVVRLRS